MIPKSGNRFSDKIMLKQNVREHDPEKHARGLDPGLGYRFPAFAKPVSAGAGRSEKIMLKQKVKQWLTITR